MIQAKWTLFRVMAFLCLFMNFALANAWAAVQLAPDLPREVSVYTYHTHPPFITMNGEGLTYDLADYLTKKSNGRFKFSVKAMSRPRVNKMLAESGIGIIPWVNPVWFNDREEKKYIWGSIPLMEDENACISHQENKVVYNGPDSLEGLTFGGLRFHVYDSIDDYINQGGRLRRVDAENHIDNFHKLVKKRIDMTITPRSGAEYLIKQEGLKDFLYFSPTPHSIYERRVIVTNKGAELLFYINTVLQQMIVDPEWLKTRSQYQ